MMIWVSKESTGRPNDQMALLIETCNEHHDIRVKMLGDCEEMIIPIRSIRGFKYGDVSIMFDKPTKISVS